MHVEREPLDSLLSELSGACSDQDLRQQLHLLFVAFDTNKAQLLTFPQMCEGLSKLDLTPRIYIGLDDYMVITHQNTLCRPDGSMSKSEFEHILLRQLRCSVLRNMRQATALASNDRTDSMELVLRGINRLLFDTQNLISRSPSLSPPLSPQASMEAKSAMQQCDKEVHGDWRCMTQIASDIGELDNKVNILSQKVDLMQNFMACRLQDMNVMISRLASLPPHSSHVSVCYSVQPNMPSSRETTGDMRAHQKAEKHYPNPVAAAQGDAND